MYSLPPVHSLPVELLTRIFLLGANANYPYHQSPFLFCPDEVYESPSLDFQIAVSQTCHKWRSVAINTPVLWSWIHFRERGHIERAKTLLARCAPRNPDSFTASHLLDVLISTVSPKDPNAMPNSIFDNELDEIFKLIVPHTLRWRSFHLYVCDASCKAVARRYLSTCGPAPSLVTLQLYHFEEFECPADLFQATYRPPVICFSNSVPQIKNVSLIGVNMPWMKGMDGKMLAFSGDNFKMDNLESIQLALHSNDIRPPYKYWETMLQRSPDLQHLSLHYSGPKKQDNTDPATLWPPSPLSRMPPGELEVEKPRVVTLPGLKQLSLTDLEEDRYACDILQRILCENLQVLKLGTMEDDLEAGSDDFTELVELITGIKTPDTLRASPSPSSQTEFLSLFTKIHSPFPNIHNLHTLTLTHFGCSYSSFEALLRSLVGLKVIDLNFRRLKLTEGATVREAWKLFVVQTNHLPLEDASAYPAVLLPRLECFSIQGLLGQHISDIIHSRFRVRHLTRERRLNGPPYENQMTEISMPRYVVSDNGKGRAKDTILDALIKNGGIMVQTSSSEDVERVPVEVKFTVDGEEAEDDEDEDEDDEDESSFDEAQDDEDAE